MTPQPVEVVGWGPEVATRLDRVEQAFFVVFVALCILVFMASMTAVAVAYRR